MISSSNKLSPKAQNLTHNPTWEDSFQAFLLIIECVQEEEGSNVCIKLLHGRGDNWKSGTMEVSLHFCDILEQFCSFNSPPPLLAQHVCGQQPSAALTVNESLFIHKIMASDYCFLLLFAIKGLKKITAFMSVALQAQQTSKCLFFTASNLFLHRLTKC